MTTITLEYAQIETIVRDSLIDQISMLKDGGVWNESERSEEAAIILAMLKVLRFYSTPKEWEEYCEENC